MKNKLTLIAVSVMALGITACSSVEYKGAKYHNEDGTPADPDAKKAEVVDEQMAATQKQLEEAYRKGVAETVETYQGQVHGRKQFVYEPPVTETVRMPAATVNGAMYPARDEVVVVSPGRWVEEDADEVNYKPMDGSK